MTVVSMNYLLEAGVHFGHQKRRWNPKMKEYIYTTRDDIYIIDLQKTAKCLEKAYDALKKIAEDGGTVLFVGTKKQAQEAAEESANRTNMYFVNERWLGGTLTNFRTIRSRIKRMEQIEKIRKQLEQDKEKVTDLKRIETEKKISGEEYVTLLMEADPTKRPIRKDRYCLIYNNQYFEIDVYPFWHDQAIMEIELRDENETIDFPKEIKVIKEVTGDASYKNASLADI